MRFLHFFTFRGDQVSDSYHLIFDTRRFETKNFDLAMIKKLMPVLGTLYPETLHRLHLIHANFFIKATYSTVKSFLPERTLSKIRVVGTDPEEIKQSFQVDGIMPEHLPVWLEGTNKSADAPTEPSY